MKTTHFCPARWALAFFVPMLPVICAAALYTYLVDPLWQWPHSRHLERWHRDFNERIQKTNYLASREVNIDTLIIGNSRSRNFKTEWMGTENGFNYTISSGRPYEFARYIEYARGRSGTPIKLLLVNTSFTCVFKNESDWEKPSYYIANAESSVKKLRNLFSLSAFGYALEASKTPSYRRYFVNRFGTPEYAYPDMQYNSYSEKQQAVELGIESYTENGAFTYQYDEAYPQYLSDIHKAAGDAETIIYTPPLAWQLLKVFFANEEHIDDYERWLYQLVTEFGKVYHFLYPNPIAMDNSNFNDTQHPTAETAELIISIIMDLRSGAIQENTEYGGILLTQDNIEELLPRFRGEFQSLELRT